MQQLKKLPVLILAYNRFEKFHRCINTLNKQGIKNIYISIDGPKNDFDFRIQEQIFNFCRNNKFNLDIKINQFHNNNGCRLGPVKGITWFFEEINYGVILEDDVIVSTKCIQAFSFLLQKYYKNEKYMSISAFNEYTNKEVESLYSLPVWRSWGWASWAEKWHQHLDFLKIINDLNIWQLYKLLPKDLKSINTVKLVKASQLNLLDAWDYEFNFSHIVNKKSSLTLGGINSLVYGFDNTATHSFDLDSIDIDFNLFSEREFDLSNISKYNKQKTICILKKCGFLYGNNKHWFFNQVIFLQTVFCSVIFYLRIVKRIMYKKL